MIRTTFVCLNAYKAFNPSSSAHIGGTEVQMHEIGVHLSKHAGYEVSFIVGDFGQAKKEQYGTIDVYSSFTLVKSLLHFLRAPFMLWHVLFRIRPDVIISSPAGPEVGIIALYVKLMRARYIFRAASDVDCNRKKEQSMDIISRILYRTGIANADFIIVQHGKQQEDLQKFYGRESTVIENGYFIPSTLPSPSPSPQLGRGENRIIWIGSSRQVKRIDLFFELAKQLPEYEFDMVLSQSGDTAIYQESKQQVTNMPNIHFHGELTVKNTNILLKKSYILLGTSDYEGSPNTYAMALLYGVPIVSLRVPCIGLCAEGDMGIMKKNIQSIMSHEDIYMNLRSSGREYAKQHHDIERVIRDWISVIRTTNYSR